MRRNAGFLMLLALALPSCRQAETYDIDEEPTANDIAAFDEQFNAAGNDTVVEEGPIDPNGAQGAAQVVQHFAALVEQKRFAEAAALGEEDFTAALDKKAEIHAEIGAPGAVEGAAGSLYVEVPLRFYGVLGTGKPFSQRAVATLRRVNNVPGSTEQQRQWRIYRLDMKQPD